MQKCSFCTSVFLVSVNAPSIAQVGCLGLNLGFFFPYLCLCAQHWIQQKILQSSPYNCPASNSFTSLQQITRSNQTVKGRKWFNLQVWKFKTTAPASTWLWWQGILCHIVAGLCVRICLHIREHRETENVGAHNSFRRSIKPHILKIYSSPGVINLVIRSFHKDLWVHVSSS